MIGKLLNTFGLFSNLFKKKNDGLNSTDYECLNDRVEEITPEECEKCQFNNYCKANPFNIKDT